VEKAFIPVTFYEHVVKNLPEATFVDATGWLDEIRVPKSAEEIELIQCAASMQDACLEELKRIIQPGKRDLEVYAEAHCFLSKRGSERGLVQIGSGPLGTIVPFDVPHFQNRVIKEGDQVTALVEVNAPGGYYAETMAVYTVGKQPPQLLQDAMAAALEAQQRTVKSMVPGADPKELWDDFKEFCIGKGYFPPARSFAHGQGQSLVDRPNLRPDEPWKIKPNMNIAVHPVMVRPGVFCPCCDNFLTTDGAPVRMHKHRKEIMVL
jgi:Xaa-Pro aminopeptidase